MQNRTDALASMHNCINTEGLTFRAELSTSGAERLELARTQREEARRGPLHQSLKARATAHG
jgi:hypothetical protein